MFPSLSQTGRWFTLNLPAFPTLKDNPVRFWWVKDGFLDFSVSHHKQEALLKYFAPESLDEENYWWCGAGDSDSQCSLPMRMQPVTVHLGAGGVKKNSEARRL